MLSGGQLNTKVNDANGIFGKKQRVLFQKGVVRRGGGGGGGGGGIRLELRGSARLLIT